MELTPAVGPRDQLGRLRCQVPGCRVAIAAPTGTVELLRLVKHYAIAHLARITMADALKIRAKWERGER